LGGFVYVEYWVYGAGFARWCLYVKICKVLDAILLYLFTKLIHYRWNNLVDLHHLWWCLLV